MAKRGLTTIELLLSIAIIGLIMSASVPFYFFFFAKSKSESSIKEMTTSIHRAKIKAMAGEFDDNWSVNVGGDGKIIIFRGLDYAGRNQLYDEVTDLESGINVSGQTIVSFSKNSGLPTSVATILITDTNNDHFSLLIDSYGNSSIEKN